MNGLELSKLYYETYGKPMLKEQFPHLLPYLAAGMCGAGSECFGFDDEVSRDHDFEPGFQIFLPGEDVVDRRDAFLLERAYAKLPKEFMGVKRPLMAPAGGARHGVFRTAEFFAAKTGTPDGYLPAGGLTAAERSAAGGHGEIEEDLTAWLRVPEQSLAEATNGEIYFDNYGEVTKNRAALSYFPEDVRRKKLAGHLLLMAQSGQYNFRRCLLHGESAAAQLAAGEFVRSGISVIFLLNRVYQPYYKWSFRALRALPYLSMEAELFEYLLTTDNEGSTAEEKYDVIEGIAADVIDLLADEQLTKAVCGDLEKHAYSVTDSITDATLRNMHVLAAV